MKINLFIILIFLAITNSYTQTNIVVNGSFEDAIDPDCSWGNYGFCPEGVSYNKVVEYFENFPGWFEPKKKFPCTQTFPGIGTSDILCKSNAYPSRTGNRLGHATAGEFLIGELSEETEKNIYYYAEFYAYTWYIDYFGLGIRFYDKQPKQCGGGMLSSPKQSSGASDVFAPMLVLPLEQYTKVSKYVIHNEKYKYIGLGQHNGFASKTILYDDVRILKLNANACPPYWKFQHTEFNTNMLFQASDYITLGENHDNTQAVGPVYFRSGSKTVLKAGNTINILPGTVYEPNSFVHMAIEPCGNGPCPPPVVNNAVYTVCNTNPLVFTQPNTTGVFYSWSPTIYLDNPSVSSPVFTPPSNFAGVMEYTVTATSICGFSQTAKVKLKIDTDPNPNPWFTIVNPAQPPYHDTYNFAVDINVSPHTEWVKFEILQKGTNNVIKFGLFERDVYFACCNLSLSTKLFLPYVFPCGEYDVRISTKNFCYPNIYSQTYNWNKNYPFNLQLFPNVFSPPNPPNEALFITADGVTMFNIHVYSSWWQLKYQKVGFVNDSPFMVWDGKCNIGVCSGNYVLTGYYQVVLKLYGCNGLVYDDAKFVYVFLDNNRIGQFENDSITEVESSLTKMYRIFPNPSKGMVEVYFTEENEQEKTVAVIDFTGKLVLDKKVYTQHTILDLSAFSDGMYFIILNEGGKSYKEKIVISK